jgi:hypothetical protein
MGEGPSNLGLAGLGDLAACATDEESLHPKAKAKV